MSESEGAVLRSRAPRRVPSSTAPRRAFGKLFVSAGLLPSREGGSNPPKRESLLPFARPEVRTFASS
jgi:hypothetical protein